MNYFELIGLPGAFDIDITQLEKRYFELQRQYHPDRGGQTALQQSMNINEAYEALKSPLKRAQHLLKLAGIAVNTEHDTYKPTHALLTEIMELRESLSMADAERGAQLQAQVQQQRQQCLQELSEAFKGNRYDDAAQLTMRLNYLTKFLDESRILLQKKYASVEHT